MVAFAGCRETPSPTNKPLGRPMIASTNVRIWDVVGAVPYEVRYLLINYFPDIINLN